MSASTCAWLTARTASWAWSRLRVVSAWSAAACSACSCAASESALSCTSSAPALTSCPDLKCTLRTSPATSLARSAPRTGLSVPTDLSCDCQGCACTSMVETVCGCGLGMEAISFLIWRYLPPASAAISTMTAPIMISMRFVIVEFSCARGRDHFCCETTAPGASDGAAGFHQPPPSA